MKLFSESLSSLARSSLGGVFLGLGGWRLRLGLGFFCLGCLGLIVPAFCTPVSSSRRMMRFAPRCKVGVGVAAGVTARVAAGVAGVLVGVAVRLSVRVFLGASGLPVLAGALAGVGVVGGGAPVALVGVAVMVGLRLMVRVFLGVSLMVYSLKSGKVSPNALALGCCMVE